MILTNFELKIDRIHDHTYDYTCDRTYDRNYDRTYDRDHDRGHDRKRWLQWNKILLITALTLVVILVEPDGS